MCERKPAQIAEFKNMQKREAPHCSAATSKLPSVAKINEKINVKIKKKNDTWKGNEINTDASAAGAAAAAAASAAATDATTTFVVISKIDCSSRSSSRSSSSSTSSNNLPGQLEMRTIRNESTVGNNQKRPTHRQTDRLDRVLIDRERTDRVQIDSFQTDIFQVGSRQTGVQTDWGPDWDTDRLRHRQTGALEPRLGPMQQTGAWS